MAPKASAHLTGGLTKITAKYKIQFLVLPKNPLPGENATLNFSVQDLDSNNLRNITASITITLHNVTTFIAPRQLYDYGDFLLEFVFLREGTYLLTIAVFDRNQSYPADFEITVSRMNRRLSQIGQAWLYVIWFTVLFVLFLLLFRERRRDLTTLRRINAKY